MSDRRSKRSRRAAARAPTRAPPAAAPAAAPAPSSGSASALAPGSASADVAAVDAPASPPIAVPPLTAEGGLIEEMAVLQRYSVVQRYYEDAATMSLKGGNSVHAFLASDLYLKRVQVSPRPGAKRKRLHEVADFRDCEEPILLRRLADGKARRDVENAVSSCSVKDPQVDGRACPGLRIRVDVREVGEPSMADIVLSFSPESEDVCSQWVEELRARITPWALIREQTLESFSKPSGQSSAQFLEKLQELYQKENMEQDSAEQGQEGTDERQSAMTTVERLEASVRWLARVREKADLVKSTAEGIANLISGSDVDNAISRALGGMTLIGPVVSVATMSICIAKLALQARDDRGALKDLCERVQKIADRLWHILFILLCASCSSGAPEVVNGTFDAIASCWIVFNDAERHLLRSKCYQALHTDHAERINDAAKELELCLRFAIRDKNTALLAFDVAKLAQTEEQKTRAVIAPPAPANVVREAIPDYEAIRDSLRSGGTTSLSDAMASLALCSSSTGEQAAADPQELESRSQGPESVGDSSLVPVSAVEGDGGYGKTTCLLLLANDRMLRDAFSYILFIEFGSNVQDSAIISWLAHIAKVIGLAKLAEAIRGVSPGANQVSDAVSLLQPSFANARTLLILDNVWERPGAERQWVEELAPVVSGHKDSSVVVSTRSGDLAECADEDRRFTVGRVADEKAARRIIEIHAGLKPGVSKPQGSAGRHVSECDEAQYADVISLMLRHCDGWHLALGMCGALAKLKNYRWASIGGSLRRKLVGMRPEFTVTKVRHPGLQAIIETNLGAAQEMLKDVAATSDIASASDQLAFESVDLMTLFSRLSVLDTKRELPYYCVGPLFGLTDSCGEDIGALLEKAGVTKTRGNGRQRVLWIHDLQHASAELMCHEAGVPLARVHANFVESFWKQIATDDLSIAAGGRTSRSGAWDPMEAEPGGDNLATYISSNLVRHLVASECDSSGAFRIELGRDNPGEWNVVSKCLRYVCSYKWIRARGHKFGRAAVVRDFATLLDAVDQDDAESRAAAEQNATDLRAARRGTAHALRLILKLLQRIASERFRQDLREDSGLAGELYGRLAVLKFKGVDDAAWPFAQQVAAMLQASVCESAQPPWLRPVSECYRSVEDTEDKRCALEFTSSRSVHEIAYVQIGGDCLVISGDADGGVLVHDTRLAGEAVGKLMGHCDRVRSVVSVGRAAGCGDGDVLAASCSWDGTVRLWGCEHRATKDEFRCLHSLESSNDEALECLDVTPGAKRVVAGGQGPQWEDPACVHVWTRRAAGGGDAYAAIALSGHKSLVTAVAVSRSGESIVSASYDRTVRIWRVAMDARAADGPPQKVVFRDRDTSVDMYSLALAADGKTAYAGIRDRNGSGEIAVVDCEAAREVAMLWSDKVESDVLSLALLESSGGGVGVGGGSASARVLAGHRSGVISEWDLESRSCLAVYGDPRSRAGLVLCIAPGFTEQVSDDGGAGQRRVEFAAAYDSGVVCVWRASSRSPSCAHTSALPRAAGGAAVAGAGIDEYAVERHVDTPDDRPSCLTASGDGRLLVSGSRDGVLCVWDTEDGVCVATLRGHDGGITGIDVSEDGKVIASSSWDKTARVWTMQGIKKWTASAVLVHEAPVTCAVLTADAKHAITGDEEGGVRVWNIRTGELVGRPRAEHLKVITFLAVVHGATARSGISDSRASFSRGRPLVSSLDGSVDNEPHSDEESFNDPETVLFASRDEGGTCTLWSLKRTIGLRCERNVSVETDLGSVFFSSMELKDSRERWREQRLCYAWPDKRVFVSADDPESMRRYEASASYHGDALMVAVAKEHDARLCSDSEIPWKGMAFCFERQEGKDSRLLACSGLYDGTVVISDLIPSTS